MKKEESKVIAQKTPKDSKRHPRLEALSGWWNR